MKDAITVDGTDAALTKQREPRLFGTTDAANLAGIKARDERNLRKRFISLADRLNLQPAEQRRRDCGGGSLQKFWTLEQVQAVKAEHERTAKPITLTDRIRRIKKFSVDVSRGIVAIGYELIACKAEVGHGDWANWLAENFSWTDRTARNFMTLAERFGDNPEFDAFKPSTLQAMLTLPAGDEEKFIAEQADAGHPVETQSARQLKENIKQHNQKKSKGTKRKTFSDLKPTNPAITPFSRGTIPPAQTDSEPVNVISTNDREVKLKNVFQFEADKPRRNAILKGYHTPCQDPADLSIQEDDSATDSLTDETAESLADLFKLILAVNDADKLRRIRDFVDARLAAISGKKDNPAQVSAHAVNQNAATTVDTTKDNLSVNEIDSEPVIAPADLPQQEEDSATVIKLADIAGKKNSL